MSTRCQTRINFGGERVLTFYRHCDGYPNGHGLDLCNAVIMAGDDVIRLLSLMEIFKIEIEPANVPEHGDIEFLYEVDYPDPYHGHWADGKPDTVIKITNTRSWSERKVVYEGNPSDVRMKISTDQIKNR